LRNDKNVMWCQCVCGQGGEAKLLDRCAEGMLFGALPPCPSCDEGQLVCVRGVEYKCTGYASGTPPSNP
jgi:hypothetical protein